MDNFAAIDFETANQHPTSVCSVGLVVVRNGIVSDSFYSLIQPEPNYYTYWCQRVHGLGHSDTDSAPVFPHVWAQIEPLITDLPLVAHNKRFDENCLRAVMRCYQMTYPDYTFLCTLQAARQRLKHLHLPNHQLQTVAAACGFDLTQHHNALADAQACAAIALQLL
jgi:DNA polymerase-3 subunit epsilon